MSFPIINNKYEIQNKLSPHQPLLIPPPPSPTRLEHAQHIAKLLQLGQHPPHHLVTAQPAEYIHAGWRWRWSECDADDADGWVDGEYIYWCYEGEWVACATNETQLLEYHCCYQVYTYSQLEY